MKKLYALLPTLAALVVPGKASAQMMPDSTVQIIAYWEVGDQVAVVFSFFPVDHCQPATSTQPPRGRRPQPLFVRVDSAFSDDALRHDFHHLAVGRDVSFILLSDHIATLIYLVQDNGFSGKLAKHMRVFCLYLLEFYTNT
ncbi:MAG: hypothetical protein J6W98_01790 [Bacteroidales bacterium]|nr:hypothetical protein [Bacteroidales bacterium]